MTAMMNSHEILKYIQEGNEDGVEYALEWIGVNSTDPTARYLVMAVFSAREKEDEEDE